MTKILKTNLHEYITYEEQECVRFKTEGKYQLDVLVDRQAWDKYLFKHKWTVTMQGSRALVKTSIDKQTVFLWRFIIENEKDELDYWNTTIDHINNNPLDNRLSNLRIYNPILNNTNISSKFAEEDRQYIHKVTGGYKIHFNLGGKTYYLGFFGVATYGSDEAALKAAKLYRDNNVPACREEAIQDIKKKSRTIEFERGLRDKIDAGEHDEIITILQKYNIL